MDPDDPYKYTRSDTKHYAQKQKVGNTILGKRLRPAHLGIAAIAEAACMQWWVCIVTTIMIVTTVRWWR
jgi:hypothetical protein